MPSIKKEIIDDAEWDDFDELIDKRRPRKAKRRKTAAPVRVHTPPIEEHGLDVRIGELRVADSDFDDVLESDLRDWIRERDDTLRNEAKSDGEGILARAMTRSDAQDVLFEQASLEPQSVVHQLVKRKLELSQGSIQMSAASTLHTEAHPLLHAERPAPPDEVLTALHAIRRTHFENSFMSRLHGCHLEEPPTALFVDWNTWSPWTDLMNDIRDHYILSHHDAEPPFESNAPIVYTNLSREHLPQVHDLLCRTFWAGVNVSDSLDHEAEKCTIVATYKSLVVGVALLSEPQHAYVTYLAVRAGWENAHIATTMLYYLIQLNPGRHITLHVSANNPAMLLYNRFGFKAEKFVVGFYDAYLDPESRASKNAFLLRLRP